MIIFIHRDGKKLLEIRKDKDKCEIGSSSLTEEFFSIAKKYPDELIIWVNQQYLDHIHFAKLDSIFQHNLIMASYSLSHNPVSKDIGYIDQFPFVNPGFLNTYATWFMSTDIGGIYASTLNEFSEVFKKINDFDFLLNSISKLGQKNSLFCYSEPDLYISSVSNELKGPDWSIQKVFQFVGAHYHKARLILLFLSFLINKKKFTLMPFFFGVFQRSFFRSEINLKISNNISSFKSNHKNEVEVVIPTFRRASMLIRLLDELNQQTLFPKKVIVIEQVDSGEVSSLKLSPRDYNWEIEHLVTKNIGACNARNLGLDLVQSELVFLCDDDNKLEPQVLQNLVNVQEKYNLDVVNTAYPQPEEPMVFKKMKQWASFGSGNALLKRKKIGKIRFDTALEGGYGEDVDFGYQLRKNGVDIVYTPEVIIQHLKSEEGGFREILKRKKVENLKNSPKPSPSMMVLLKKHYSKQMIFGYKLEMFMRYYSLQKIRNPLKYIRIMNKRWALSEAEANKLFKI